MGMNFWNRPRCSLKFKGKFLVFTAYLPVLQSRFQFRGYTTHKRQQNNNIKSLNKALRIIDLVTPNSTYDNSRHDHIQVVQDLQQTYSRIVSEANSVDDLAKSNTGFQNSLDQLLSSFSFRDDAISPIIELHRERMRVSVRMLSYALSVCGSRGNIHSGTQFQCLAVKNGFFANIYMGTSLISMYSKGGDLRSASMVFEEMPVRNVVSWTALISGFAQNYQVDVCLQLYSQMRMSAVEPNEFTLTSVLSACVSNGSLGPGKCAHCLVVLLGFALSAHVANALISMYCKCGDVGDAFCIFKEISDKDVVSWNSMIVGYALHGLAWKAIDLFEEMRKQKVKPNKITFLGVLSSCRHAGLVKQGEIYFKSMLEYGVEPDLGHYSCIVDLFGRAGLVEEGRDFIFNMPIKPNAVIWGSLLSSCRLHNNIWVGIEAAENRLSLEPTCAATHVLLAKLYARAGLWDQVAKMWKMMKDAELKTNPGYSWIEVGNEVISFRADDTNNSKLAEVFCMLNNLSGHLTTDHEAECDADILSR